MRRLPGIRRLLVPKTKLNSYLARNSNGKKCKIWCQKDALPHTGWSIVKLFSEASNCQLLSAATSGLCKMKPDTSENSLNDWEIEHVYFINHFTSSAEVPVCQQGQTGKQPQLAWGSRVLMSFPFDNALGNRSFTSHYSFVLHCRCIDAPHWCELAIFHQDCNTLCCMCMRPAISAPVLSHRFITQWELSKWGR